MFTCKYYRYIDNNAPRDNEVNSDKVNAKCYYNQALSTRLRFAQVFNNDVS